MSPDDLEAIRGEIGSGNARTRARAACWALAGRQLPIRGAGWLRENILHRGSMQDIQAGIDDFEQERAQRLSEHLKTGWPREVADLFKSVWDEANKLAEQRFAAEREGYLQRIRDLERKLRR